MSRCPDYHRLVEPFVARSADAIIAAGSKQRVGVGCAGDVFLCKLRTNGEEAVMKTSKTDLVMWPRNGPHGSSNQRWLRQDCEHDEDYFVLFSEAFPSRVLEVYRAAEGTTPAQLSLGELKPRARHQKWRLDAEGRLVSKLGTTTCVAVFSGERRSPLCLSQLTSPLDDTHRWFLQPVRGGAVLIVSCFNNYVVDFVGETDVRELYYLARWKSEPGLVPLRHVVWGFGHMASLLIMKRLGKQLGPGTQPLDSCDCVLRDIRDGKASARSPARAARQLLAVACFLRRMHLEGYTHNDLHDGNILCNDRADADASSFSVIDLGSVSEAGHWKGELGDAYGSSWSVTRDWRCFALHFVSLVDGRSRRLWDLVGTTNRHPQLETPWAVPWHVNVAANPANGSLAQKWTVDTERNVIMNRGSGKVLDISGQDGCTMLVFPQHGGSNQKWKFVDGSIVNPAKRTKLDICGGIGGSRVISHESNGGENQQWRYDEVSGEIVNPASRKVLDMHGEVILPEDIKLLLGSLGKDADPVCAQLLEALFKARSDPNEICALVGLLASRGPTQEN
mmetsp:Transcript_73140/g.169617  ORF Transcript_73140/g.169617 Transcript_73140/m.169617 type:complete len:562 (-) Transcript_73140:78-1763(-)